MQMPYCGLTTVAGLRRREIRNWWADNGHPFDVCTLYNDGVHLFTLDRNVSPQLIPGSFIAPPVFLTHFPYTEVERKIGKFRLIHRGHRLTPVLTSVQLAIEFNGEFLQFDMQPMTIGYVIRLKSGGVAYTGMFGGLPLEVLKSK